MSTGEDKTPEQQHYTDSGSDSDDHGSEEFLPLSQAPPKEYYLPVPPPPFLAAGGGRGQLARETDTGADEGMSAGHGKRRSCPPKEEEVEEVVSLSEDVVSLSEDVVSLGDEEGERPRKRVASRFDALGIPMLCGNGKRQCSNYTAVVAQFRSHPGRALKDAYPPPISSPPSSQAGGIKQHGEQLNSSLLGIAQGLVGASKEGGNDAASTASSGNQLITGVAHPRGLNIDLNMEPTPSEPSSPADEDEDKKEAIDLNKDISDKGEGGN